MLVTCHQLPAAQWQPAPAAPLPAGQVRVFRLRVTDFYHLAQRARRWLAPTEQARAERFVRAADQQRYLVTRTGLRGLLGHYLGKPPAALRFGAGPSHKPELAPPAALRFSVAHAQGWVLLALAGHEVGVDVEWQHPALALEDLLSGSFAAPEQAAIRRGPGGRQLFFEAWTRKEALAKATGQGIDAHFASLPGLPGRYHLPQLPAQTWQVSSFEVAAGYAAALAYPPEYEAGFFEYPTAYLAS